jgi:hypothetical protein
VPFFCLNYFRLSQVDGQIAIDYHTIEKEPPKDLTWLQRFLVFHRRRPSPEPIPARTLLAAHLTEEPDPGATP